MKRRVYHDHAENKHTEPRTTRSQYYRCVRKTEPSLWCVWGRESPLYDVCEEKRALPKVCVRKWEPSWGVCKAERALLEVYDECLPFHLSFSKWETTLYQISVKVNENTSGGGSKLLITSISEPDGLTNWNVVYCQNVIRKPKKYNHEDQHKLNSEADNQTE